MALLPVLGFEAYTEYDARQVRQQLMEDEALRLVRLVASEQQRIIDSTEQILNTLASSPAVQDNLPALCQRLLTNLMAQSPRFTTAAVIDLHGHTICSPTPVDPGVDASRRAFFRLALESGSFALGGYVVGDVTGLRTIHMAKPLKNRNGDVVGVIALGLSVDWLGQQLASLALPPGSVASISDRNGIILARAPPAPGYVGQQVLDRTRFVLEGNRVAVAQATTRDEQPRMVGYSPPGAEPKGLAITVGLDRDITFAAITQANRMGLVLIIASAVLALLITGILGARLIWHPVQGLLAVADKWRKGDLAARSGVRADGSEFGRLGTAFDAMAEAQQAREKVLAESESRLRLATEGAGVGTWELDLVTGQGQWSAESVALLAAGRSTFTGDGWLAVLHPDDRGRVIEAWQRAIKDGSVYEVIYRTVAPAPDGGERWLFTRGRIEHDAVGHPIRGAGVVVDVTARLRAESALAELNRDLNRRVAEEVAAREAAQARAAQAERLQALGQLAGGIAHDFNNVLQRVEGAGVLIERRPNDETGVRRYATMLLEAAGRGASITRRLLAFAGRADLRAKPLEVATVLSGMQDVFAHSLGAAIGVEVRLANDVPPILADKGQLETALINLATNARDAMPNGGRLTLVADPESVSADGPPHPFGLSPGRFVRLAVADTGKGMDATTLARATDPFFTTKPTGVGTGLGLPMVRGFIEQSGGALNITSRPGNGTTVTLWLPAAEPSHLPAPPLPQAAEAPPANVTSRALAVTRLMLVDDEEMLRELLAEQLEEAGYRVLIAANGNEALALLAAGEAVDVLVSDLSMPGINGIAVIRAAQEARPGLPAVLLTGYASDGAALAVGEVVAGSYSLLRKPIHLKDLVDRVESLLAARENAAG